MLSESVAYFARSRPGALACVDLRTQSRLSFAALDARSHDFAAALEHLLGEGTVRGSRIALLARNSSDAVCLHIACRRLGALFTPLNWRLTARELAGLAALADPALVLFDPEFETSMSAVSAAAPTATCLKLGPGGAFEQQLGKARSTTARPPVADDDPITLLFTSGTTGQPKGVMITERNARASAFNYGLSVNLNQGSVMLCDMPMFHVVGLLAATCSTLQAGGTLLISPQFATDTTYARLADPALAVSHYFCVPQMLRMMRDLAGFDSKPLQRLVALQTGGAPHPASAVTQWLSEGITLVDGYGMTEVGTALGMSPGDKALLERKAGSIGVPAALIEARLVDRDGREVGEDEVGEIWLRGASLSPGYWRNEAATRTAFQDGWLRTGDAARRDHDGFYTLVDRWKDMYISGGENVYPAEVEAVLLELPGVSEAAVVGVPDERWGEVGAAHLVCTPGVSLSDSAVLEHCRRHLAGFKIPRHIRRVESLPRTASGKLQKGALRSGWRA